MGSHVTEYYAKKGSEVIILDNLSRQKLFQISGPGDYNLRYLRKSFPSIKSIEGDITDASVVDGAAKGVGAIIHTAGQVAVTTSMADPLLDFKVNVLGTFNVLEAARRNDAAVVFCSTNKVYGDNVNAIQLKEGRTRYEYSSDRYAKGVAEDFPIDGTQHSPYGASKLSADLYVQEYGRTYGIKSCVFRMSCVYGDRQFGVEDQGWVAWFVIAALTKQTITIYGNGKQVRDILYVDDLVRAFDLFLRSSVPHAVFNVGGGPKNTVSLLELIEELRSLTGSSVQASFSDWRPADQRVYISDISKIAKELEWEPKVTATTGIRRLFDWASNYLRTIKS